MSVLNYRAVFEKAFGGPNKAAPYAYQCRLAGGSSAKSDGSFTHGTDCASQLIEIPTGLGKTAAVVLAWLWNRVLQPNIEDRKAWPRRIVYTLPMRTLVEQTETNVRVWLDALRNEGVLDREIKVHLLMGGEESGEWDIHPEKDAILIGTQDMLISRALNRGYGMSRYRWPMHFGLLNNDCLWVMDETQLMGPALWTSAQLDWMRHARFPSLFPCETWWMSATVGMGFLKTSDRERENFATAPTLDFGDEPRALKQLSARRPCELWSPTPLEKKTAAKKKKGAAKTATPETDFAVALGRAIVAEHQTGTLSLVVCNTVATAQAVFSAAKAMADENSRCILLTSRFRKDHRKQYVDALLDFEKKRKADGDDLGGGLICVSTQVVEAGVDISAVRLWSEIAPWPSIVQRLGRLNRDGRDDDRANALFFKVPSKEGKPKKDTKIGPYHVETVSRGECILGALVHLSASQPKLSARGALIQLRADAKVGGEIEAALKPSPEPYPRAMDVHGLFSTEPDVFGGFTDVSPFVRGTDNDADVTVFWRADEPKRPFPPDQLEGPAFDPQEGVTVRVHAVRQLLEPRCRACLWNDKTERWEPIWSSDICPGMVLMLRGSAGGYDSRLGWTGIAADKLPGLPPPGPFAEDFRGDPLSQTGEWMELADHLAEVRDAAERIADRLELPEPLRQALLVAATYHDIGKALPAWQDALPKPHPAQGKLWAKSRFLLIVRPAKEGFGPDAVETLLAEAGIDANPAETPLSKSTEGCHCWQLCRKETTSEPSTWLEKLNNLAGIAKAWRASFRPRLRHEAGSALALWHRYFREKADFPALTIYLTAAHHGKVRTVLTSREAGGFDVCGIKPTSEPINWEGGMPMDFASAADGTSGSFSEDGTVFTVDSPGWTSLIADLLGPTEGTPPSLPTLDTHQDKLGSFGPFQLAYLESLLRAADANPLESISKVFL